MEGVNKRLNLGGMPLHLLTEIIIALNDFLWVDLGYGHPVKVLLKCLTLF